MKKIPLKLRITFLCIFLLTLCCVFLTIILNLSAIQMANVIEATPILPATKKGTEENVSTSVPISLLEPAVNKSSQAPRRLFFYQSIVSMVLVVGIGGGLTYYIVGKALKPLHKLNREMKKRTVHNLSMDLPVPESHDEIADLTSSFNQMSTKLDNAFAMQKRFSQSAAHELRTPLTVLKTKVDVFKKKPEHTTQEYDKLLTVITDHTNRLSDLVKNLLDLANMDSLKCDQEVKVKTLLEEIAEELIMLAEEKNICITVLGQDQIIKGNQSLLHRAFYNLIENAIKYTPDNGSVEITIYALNNHTVVTIKDSGIGIPIEMQPLIFEPFFRVDKSRSRQMGGAGLGLTTVKNIMDMHGGTIIVSDNVHGGTIFEITLFS